MLIYCNIIAAYFNALTAYTYAIRAKACVDCLNILRSYNYNSDSDSIAALATEYT